MSPQSPYSREWQSSIDWCKEAKKELQIEANVTLQKMQETIMIHSLESSLRNMGGLQKGKLAR